MTNYSPAIAKINDTFLPVVEDQLLSKNINMTEYQRECVLNALNNITDVLEQNGLSMSNMDGSQITQILLQVSALQLNAAATPREVYFIIRNKKSNPKIEMGIEGDGNDAILSRFGRGIKKVYPFWYVREEDEFKLPRYVGLDVAPPEWVPSYKGRGMYVVYPILSEGDTIHYHITTREDVKPNLIAHMMNNLMWDKNKEEKKRKIREFALNHTLDEILDNEEMRAIGQISPAWSEPQSREAMILRKMRNNIVKKIPKDFSDTFAANVYQEDDEIVQSMKIVNEVESEAPQQLENKNDYVNFDDMMNNNPIPHPEPLQANVQASDEQLKEAEVKQPAKEQKFEQNADDLFQDFPDMGGAPF